MIPLPGVPELVTCSVLGLIAVRLLLSHEAEAGRQRAVARRTARRAARWATDRLPHPTRQPRDGDPHAR